MDTRRTITIILVVGLVVGATPALAALADYAAPIEGEVPIQDDNTPTVVLAAPDGAETNLVDVWEGDALNITTSQGDIRVSGDPGGQVRLAVDDIEGAQTQVTAIDAGGNWINLDPADKNRVDVRGDADTLAFSEIAVDDGSTDLQVGGPVGGTAELRLHGLSAGTQYALYDASRDEVLGAATADGSGVAQTTVDLPDGTHALQVRTAGSFGGPTVTDPSPTGQITTQPDAITANVTAAAWPAEVTFVVDGTTVDTVTVTESGTVTGDVSSAVDALGAYDYTVTVTDALARSDTATGSFETPSELTLREEHAPQNLVTNSSATVRFFTVDGEIAIERSAQSDGTISLEGLPNSEFVVFVESPNHYDRTIYIESIFEQNNMFLLNETVFPRAQNEAVRSRFIYEDLTGDFPRAETTIQVQRAIDLNGDNRSQFRTVAGDYLGASNEFEGVFERGTRYRVILVNRETGDRYVAGSHIPTEELSQTIRVSGLVEEAKNETGVVADTAYTDSGNIELVYRDPANATDELTVTVEPRDGGDPIYTENITGPLGTYGTTVTLNATQSERDWVVTFDAGDRHRSAVPVGGGGVAIPFPVPGWILTLLGSMAVTFVGALYGPRTAVLGCWSMVFVAAGLAMFGWGAFTGVSVLVAMLIAVAATFISVIRP
jgi:hypothetical protein